LTPENADSMRFRPGQHLRRQGDIRAVREKGSKLDCKAFTMWWTPSPGIFGAPRACFVASTQAVGGAVQRNSAKRRLREVFRRHQGLLPPTCDFLVVARRQVNQWPFAQLEQAFADASGRVRAQSPQVAP
jgi:ribonuclease P protein component